MPLTTKQKGGAAALAAMLAIASPIYVFWEGEKTMPYLDVVGVPTVCSGDTRNVVMGKRLTAEECKARTQRILEEYGAHVAKVNPSITEYPHQWAAHTIFTANIGKAGYSNSSVFMLDKAGRHRLGCRAIQKYKYAGKKVFQGLINRRNGVTEMVGEYELCLADAVERDLNGE